MEQDMERRRREWQSEIDKMSTDFFQMRTDKDRTFGTIPNKMSISGGRADGKAIIEKDQHGNPVFRASFNVEDFKPEEVNVKLDAHKITVQAKHEEKGGGKSVSREYSRELHIPNEIDPMALQCKIGNDGILTVEAPLPVPEYDKGMSPPLSKPSVSSSPNISGPSFQTLPSSGPSSGPTSSQPFLKQTLSDSAYTLPPSKAQSMSFRNSPPPPPPPSATPHHVSTATHFTSGPTTSSAFQPAAAAPPYSASRTAAPPGTATPPGTASPATVGSEKMYKIEIDIEDFCPEELTVKTQDNKLSINARREINTGNRKSTKEISREFVIPTNVDPMMVKAFFTDGGKLVVEAPYINTTDCGGSTLTGR